MVVEECRSELATILEELMRGGIIDILIFVIDLSYSK
jgi:hypothetical protein